MKKELDEKLCTKYPKIFVNRNGDMKDTAMCWGFDCGDGWYPIIDRLCSNLQWNTDNNNKDYVIKNLKLRILIPFLTKIIQKITGKYNLNRKKQWNPLVVLRGFLLGRLYKLRQSIEFTYVESGTYPQVVASQVKEKFGSLRFYVEGASPQQYAVIEFVETLSYHICESCGSSLNVGHTQGWISTLCEECGKSQSSWKNDVEEKEEDNE